MVHAESMNVLVCRAQDYSYAIDLKRVEGIVRGDRLDTDSADEQVAGTHESADGPVVVFRLASLLGLPASASTAGTVILTRAGQLAVGLLTEQLSQRQEMSVRSLFPLPEAFGSLAQQTFAGVFLGDHQLLPLLEPAGLFQQAAATATAFVNKPDFSFPLAQHGGRLIEFSLGDFRHLHRPVRFGLSMAAGLELLDDTVLVPIANALPHYRGVMAWRGQPIAVFDLADRLGLAASADSSPSSRVLVVRADATSAPIGLLVRPPIRMLPLPQPHRPCPAWEGVEAAPIRAWFEFRDTVLAMLDVPSIMAS